MKIVIAWQYNQKLNKWIICVFRDQNCLIMLVRESKEECEQWAEKNIHTFRKGKMPQYG